MLGPIKERRIVQWGIAYLGGAWLVIQVLDALSDPWSIPDVVLRGTTVLLGVGFLGSLVIAWYHGEKGRQRVSGPELVLLAVLGLGAVLSLRAAVRDTTLEPAGLDTPGVPVDPNTIAVLPFLDLSPQGTQQYFGDGIADEVISVLSRDGRLKVAGRSSSFALRDRSAGQLGAELSVASVLEGTIRTEGDRIVIQASLVSTDDGFERWSRRFERSASSVLQIQAEIAAAVASELTGVDVSTPEASQVSPEAMDLYFQARAHWTRRTGPDVLRAIELFERATVLAPDFARGFSGLADAYAVSGFYSYLPADSAFPSARRHARTALDLDPELSDAFATIAYTRMYYDRDWAAAERNYARALTLNPDNAVAHQWYGNLLIVLGRHEEAIRELRLAVALEPLSIITQAALPWGLYHAGDYDEALRRFGDILQLDPQYELAHYWSGWIYEQLGDLDRATASLEQAVLLSDSSGITLAALARAYGLAGRQADAERLLGHLADPLRTGNAPSYEIAKAYIGLGDRARALEWLERAFDEHALQLAFLAVDPQIGELRDQPEVRSLLVRLGLDSVAPRTAP